MQIFHLIFQITMLNIESAVSAVFVFVEESFEWTWGWVNNRFFSVWTISIFLYYSGTMCSFLQQRKHGMSTSLTKDAGSIFHVISGREKQCLSNGALSWMLKEWAQCSTEYQNMEEALYLIIFPREWRVEMERERERDAPNRIGRIWEYVAVLIK